MTPLRYLDNRSMSDVESSDRDTIEALRRRIVELEARIRELRKRIEELEAGK